MEPSFVYNARAAAAVANQPAETLAIKAASTHHLRAIGNERPEGRLDPQGEWRPSGADEVVYLASAPPALSGRQAFRLCCSVGHCAALFGADISTTRKYARVFRSTKDGNIAAALRVLPAPVAAQLMVDALAK